MPKIREQWLIKRQNPELQRLLNSAARALQEEDAELSRLLARNAEANRGLLYWLFETTLVYIIFKAWLKEGIDVEWEVAYAKAKASKGDLVVRDNGLPHALFEAKWWPNKSAKTLSFLESDLYKMASWKGPLGARVLLCFWFTPTPGGPTLLGPKRPCLISDTNDLKRLCAHSELRVEPIYVASFDTDIARCRGKGGAYFGLAALEVQARGGPG
jgi:hypothetical protein